MRWIAGVFWTNTCCYLVWKGLSLGWLHSGISAIMAIKLFIKQSKKPWLSLSLSFPLSLPPSLPPPLPPSPCLSFSQPTEYYDEKVEQEEEIGKVCMVKSHNLIWSHRLSIQPSNQYVLHVYPYIHVSICIICIHIYIHHTLYLCKSVADFFLFSW